MQTPPDSAIVKRCFAVIYTPTRRRKRFPENCVTVVPTAEEAIAEAKSTDDTYPAQVMGPSRSSEGLRLYYLIQWLA
ncbi:MAG: hypothetical protein ABFS39_02835 [Pseudomonadota bacterium]